MREYNFVLESANEKDIKNIIETEEKNIELEYEGNYAKLKKLDNNIWVIKLEAPVTKRNTLIVSEYMSRINRSKEWSIDIRTRESYNIILWGQEDLEVYNNNIIKGQGTYKTLSYARSIAYALLYEFNESNIEVVEYIEQ